MSKQSELAQLRAKVAAQQKAASSKVNRLKKVNGADIAGTEHDVRIDPQRVKSYNTKQLKAYSEKLSGFTSRYRQFYSDVNGNVLKGSDFNQYKALERAYNNRVNRAFNKVKKLSLPRQDGTLEQRMQEMMPTRMGRQSRAVNVSYKPPVRDAKSINGPKALKVLMDDYRKRTDPTYLANRLKTDRASFIETLIHAGMDNRNANPDLDLVAKVNALTEKQFSTVWQYTDLANTAFLNYESIGNDASGTGFVLSDKDSADNMAEVRELLGWAAAL